MLPSSNWYFSLKILTILALIIFTQILTADNGWSFWSRYLHYLRHLPGEVSQTLFFRAETQRKIVAITFDDGPLARTPKLIRFLKARETPATFFLLAKRLDARNSRLYDDPLFETGLHGYRHDYFRRLSPHRIRRELDRAIRVFERYHLRHDLFRPPYGMMSRSLARILKERKIRGVIWSLDSRDWSRRDRPGMTQRILDHLAPGSVILFHDHGVRLRQLAAILDGIEARGYRIVPLSELMHYPTLRP